MNAWRIELLDDGHQRDGFDCGEEGLNVFLRSYAGQNARRDVSRTYVAVGRGLNDVIGYYTLSSGSVAFAHLPAALARRLPKYPIPTAHIGRLAVDRHYQRQGFGGVLLVDALRRVRDMADAIGIHAVTVHALNTRAADFYKGFGFRALCDDPRHLFLPMATIRNL